MAKDLKTSMHSGPFQYSGVVETVAVGSSSPNVLGDMDHPFRMGETRFDENDHEQVSAVLDMEHARAIVMGKQTASQFGYGVYDVTVQAIVSTQALNPDSTENSAGAVTARWVHPTPLRMEALKALKGLERLDDDLDPFTSGNQLGANAPAVNPLLSLDVDTSEVVAEDTEQARTVTRGSRIIRFGWDQSTPFVCRNSALSVNLNPWADGDTNDTWETQFYTLRGGGSGWFGILPRFEHSVNPLVEDGGQRLVQETWAYPVNNKMVDRSSNATQPLVWSVDPTGANIVTAEFRNVHALGGLIALEIPEWVSRGTGNNDFDLVVSVSARRWVSM